MTILPKAFFWFLVLVMLASFVGSWQCLNKVHQAEWWPERENLGYYDYAGLSFLMSFTVRTIHFFDTIIGKIICLFLITAMSFGCGRLAFRYDYLYTGLLTLQAFAAYCAWIAISLKFFSPLMPFSM